MEEMDTSEAPKSSSNNGKSQQNHPDMKRSAVKELIERYFYQLQKGCGNPNCTNSNCASSGKVAKMGPNEIAAKAIQLFSQDAKLCDAYNQPKVPRTHGNQETPSGSRASTSNAQLDEEMPSPLDGSLTSGFSSSSSSSSSSSNSTISSCAAGDRPFLNFSRNKDELTPTNKSENILQEAQMENSSQASTPTTMEAVEYLNEQIVDELVEEALATKSYGRLVHALQEVFTSVHKLGKSFCRSSDVLTNLTSSATACKLHELLGKSPGDLKKEDLRTLEGDQDKDEDSSCLNASTDSQDICMNSEQSNNIALDEAMQQDLTTEDVDNEDELAASTSASAHAINKDANELKTVNNSDSSHTDVDLESLRRVKKKLYALEESSIGEAINTNIILLAEHIKYSRENDWEKVLHCFVICFDMATNSK